MGRNVRARADIVWDGGVGDIKTGSVPTEKRLLGGTVPQLPLEAFILQNAGFDFKTTDVSKTPVMTFLQLKFGDVREISFDYQMVQKMIDASVAKVSELFKWYSVGNKSYDYMETNDRKYHTYDDLARIYD